MNEKSPNHVALLQSKTVPAEFSGTGLQKAIQTDPNLTAFRRRKLAKQQFQIAYSIIQEQFQASLEVEKYRISAQVALVKNKVDVEKDTIALSIREEFLTTLTDLGFRVEMRQLEFLTDFGVRLKSFRLRLATLDLDPNEKERILQMSHDSFDRVFRRLMELTDRLVPSMNIQEA